MRGHLFNTATVELLAAVVGLPEARLRAVRVLPRRENWLHAPWFPSGKGGGAMTIGDRIYVTPKHDPTTLGGEPKRWLAWLLLMAHELGHLPQGDRFRHTPFGHTRYVLWAAVSYFISLLRNGRHAHARAPFEIEADQGRRRLRALMESTGGCSATHPLVAAVMNNDVAAVHRWLAANASPSVAR